MKSFLVSWILPFILALLVIIIARLFFFQIDIVSDNGMFASLNENDKVVILKAKKIEQYDIVILYKKNENQAQFKRVLALPSDTILIRHSIVYINHKRVGDNEKISFEYAFSTDSVTHASKLLNTNSLAYHPILATIGIFQFSSGFEGIKKIQSNSMDFKVKRIIEEPAISEIGNSVFHPSLYWNKDNMGPLYVPAKGEKVRVFGNVYYLYKEIIEEESGQSLELKGEQVYLGKRPLDYYTFKQNYYFLLSDNRKYSDDSRTRGFIAEDEIEGKFWFKLPW